MPSFIDVVISTCINVCQKISICGRCLCMSDDWKFYLYISYTVYGFSTNIHTAACPSFNIIYPPMRTLLCPGDVITYTCAFSSSLPIVIPLWTGSGFQCSIPGAAANTIQLTQSAGVSLNTVPVSCGNLSAVMTNISGTCYTSVLTIPTPQYFNGTTVICKDGYTNTLIGSDTLNIQLTCEYCNAKQVFVISSLCIPQLCGLWQLVYIEPSLNYIHA